MKQNEVEINPPYIVPQLFLKVKNYIRLSLKPNIFVGSELAKLCHQKESWFIFPKLCTYIGSGIFIFMQMALEGDCQGLLVL